jgi:hypothetical protein
MWNFVSTADIEKLHTKLRISVNVEFGINSRYGEVTNQITYISKCEILYQQKRQQPSLMMRYHLICYIVADVSQKLYVYFRGNICVIYLSRSKNIVDGISNFATASFELFSIHF